jgi:hypothetical protein
MGRNRSVGVVVKAVLLSPIFFLIGRGIGILLKQFFNVASTESEKVVLLFFIMAAILALILLAVLILTLILGPIKIDQWIDRE